MDGLETDLGIQCEICYEDCTINLLVKLKPCGHQRFCKTCIEKLAAQGKKQCPYCRATCSNIKKRPSLPKGFFEHIIFNFIVTIIVGVGTVSHINDGTKYWECYVVLFVLWVCGLCKILVEAFRKIARVCLY